MQKQTPSGMASAAFMTKRDEVFHAGLIPHKACHAGTPATPTAAARNGNALIGTAGNAGANAAYYEYGYRLRNAGRTAPA